MGDRAFGDWNIYNRATSPRNSNSTPRYSNDSQLAQTCDHLQDLLSKAIADEGRANATNDRRFLIHCRDQWRAYRRKAVSYIENLVYSQSREEVPSLDLHGLTEDLALQAVNNMVRKTRGSKGFYVITGRGIHSSGDAIIRPAVRNYARVHDHQCRTMDNSGVLWLNPNYRN